MSIQEVQDQAQLARVGRINIDDSDERILDIISKWNIIGADFAEESEALFKENSLWYKGIPDEDIAEDKSDTRSNRIFLSLESIIPMLTAKPATPVVYNLKTSGKKEWEVLERLHQKLLIEIYNDCDLQLQKKMEVLIRQLNLYRIWFLKYGIKNGKIYVSNVLPHKIYIDKYATTIEDADFIWEEVIMPVWQVVEKYPWHETALYDFVWWEENDWTKIKIMEYWTDEYFFVVFNDNVLLHKEKNPLFDYSQTTEIDDDGNTLYSNSSNNYFRNPKKPYLCFNVYGFGDELRDFTSLLEQGIPLQNDLNERMRQISNNAHITADPYLIGKGVDKKRIQEFNENKSTGDAISLEHWEEITYTQPPSLPWYITNSLDLLRIELDNIFWTHNTSRGERWQSETATGREILRQADHDRQAPIGRALERMLWSLYSAFTHLVKVFYEEEDLIPYLWEKDSKKYLEYLKNSDTDGMEIKILAGSTLPDDKIAIKTEAMALVQLGKITDEELYRRLGWDDPAEAAKELKQEAAKAQAAMQEAATSAEVGKHSAERGQQDYDQVMQQIEQFK